MTTEERLESLERELAHVKRHNRRLVVFALVAAGVAVVAAAWIGTPGKVLAESGAKALKVVRANEFILEDADGKVRATLGVDKDGSGLRLRDENGQIRAGLYVSADIPLDVAGKGRANLVVTKGGPGLYLLDENGGLRAWLQAFGDWSMLQLFDEKGKARAWLNVVKDSSMLALQDRNGKDRAQLSVDKDGPRGNLCDEMGMSRAGLGVGKDGAWLELLDEKGKVRAGMGACKTAKPDGTITIYPESSLFLCGPDGKGIWKAP